MMVFFCLFEQIAGARNWSDSEQTLLLHCMLSGKVHEVSMCL